MSNIIPISYQQGSECHPVVNQFNRKCISCHLATGEAVNGCGPDNLADIKLIVISDHSGHYEEGNNHAMFSNEELRKPRYNSKIQRHTLENFRNAGAMLRFTLELLFGLDTYNEVWITNMVKCDPKQTKPTEQHAKSCGEKWFRNELSILDDYCPSAPILVAGNLAFKGLRRLFPELQKTLPSSMHDCRRTNHYRLGDHPLVFTVNPAAIARSDFRIETSVGLNRNDTYRIDAVKSLDPPIAGSPVRLFREDLKFIPLTPNESV